MASYAALQVGRQTQGQEQELPLGEEGEMPTSEFFAVGGRT